MSTYVIYDSTRKRKDTNDYKNLSDRIFPRADCRRNLANLHIANISFEK
jgi:hypothetical protein